MFYVVSKLPELDPLIDVTHRWDLDAKMPDDKEVHQHTEEAEYAVARLVRETGATEEQAEDLVVILGLSWSALVREGLLSDHRSGSLEHARR